MERCAWANSHPLLIEYHDKEWGVPVYDDHILFENLILETFSTGLSWLIVLKKRDAFEKAFDDFDLGKIIQYDETKINELLENKDIIRSKAKILATIQTAKAVIDIQKEFGSLSNYLWSYTNHQIIDIPYYETRNEISDAMSKDLKKRNIKFFGSVTCYSYLQAIGIFNCHQENCFIRKQ